jgi:hypothetical protein
VSSRTGPAERDPWHAPDPSFLGEQSQAGQGNHAGPELALARLVRWMGGRRRTRESREAVESRARTARQEAERKAERAARRQSR